MSDIHPVHLKTKTAKKQYYQSLLKKGECRSLKRYRPNDFKDYQLLFTHHPNRAKIEGMIDLAIRPNQEFPNSNQMFIIYDDGREDESVSYKTPLEPRRDHYFINEAMRNSVDDQIEKFRQTAKSKCQECGRVDHLHVDHYKIPFSKLRDDFLTWFRNENGVIPQLFAKDKAGRPVFDMKNKEHLEFCYNWDQYHEYYAQLRILCRSCNCSKGDYGYRQSMKRV
jgi:5-methylcytosine-specific restriction endonuclease McrA